MGWNMNYNGRTKLDYWRDWVERNASACAEETDKMDRREALYRGEVREITPLTAKDRKKNGRYRKTAHLRNIIAENIESEVNATLPQPKVTARRKSDERRAKILEDMLRNELDRLPLEELNDLMERTVPIQGGGYWLVEWDNGVHTHSTVGDVVISVLHPKQVIPQEGVFTKVEDMDAIAYKLPQTRAYIERTYNVHLDDAAEESPEARTLDAEADTAEDMVTQFVVYYRNDKGGVGRYSWVNETELEDMEDYEARRIRRCPVCGAVAGVSQKTCPECGSPLGSETVEAEESLFSAVDTAEGTHIPGSEQTMDALGMPVMNPTKLPYFSPNVYPVFLQKNVSVFGKLLGDSDVDKITDQQNTINRMETKIIDRIVKAGTRITLPDRADFKVDPEDGEKWYIGNAADKQLIDVVQFDGNLTWEMQYLATVYEEARQALGITDSFQGRRDKTAESGVAKQFAAAQSAGRLESKRVMKEAAFAELFRRIVMLKVAYADEPRPVVAEDNRGEAQYEEFNRYDFYEQDEKGQWHCILDDDRFLFSCDTATPLANNREAMWRDTTQMFQMGAFGDPSSLDTLLLYWTKLDLLHYPGAGDTKEYLEQMLQQQIQQQQMMQQQQAAAEQQAQQIQMVQQAQQAAMDEARRRQDMQRSDDAERQRRADAERQAERDTDAQAREDAWRTVQAQLGRDNSQRQEKVQRLPQVTV